MPLQMVIGTVDLDPLPPRTAVQRSGGGRAMEERVTLDGTVLPRPAHLTARRVAVASPDPSWVIRADQAAQLLALQRAGTPFTVTLLGYELEGIFTGCRFDGEAVFAPIADPNWRNYQFTLYLPNP